MRRDCGQGGQDVACDQLLQREEAGVCDVRGNQDGRGVRAGGGATTNVRQQVGPRVRNSKRTTARATTNKQERVGSDKVDWGRVVSGNGIDAAETAGSEGRRQSELICGLIKHQQARSHECATGRKKKSCVDR